MKIAIVYATFYVRGGAENAILWLTTELLQRGHQVTIFTSEYDHNDQDIPEIVRNCIMEVYAAGGNYSTWVDWLITGWRLHKRFQDFDLVNPHNFPANVWVYFAKRLNPAFPKIIWYCQEPSRLLYERDTQAQQGHYRSVKVHLATKFRQDGCKIGLKLFQKSVFYFLNVCFRNTLKTIHRKLDQRAVQACDLVLANSDYTNAKIQTIYGNRGMTCYLGIPIQPGLVAEAPTKKNYFLTVTRLERLKHVDTMINAIHVLVNQRKRRDVSLVIIGKGTQATALRKLVAQFHLESYILFPGYVSDHELHRYYGEALVVIYVPEDEPFGLVPLEAMLHKTAVIVSNNGGLVETVINDVTGIQVTPGNIEQLADAMAKMLDDRKLAIEMGAKGYQHVMAHFTFSAYVDRFEEYMHAVFRQERS